MCWHETDDPIPGKTVLKTFLTIFSRENSSIGQILAILLLKVTSQIEGFVNSLIFSLFFSSLLPTILKGFKSPLAVSTLINLYFSFRGAFEGDQSDLGKKLAIVTIRTPTVIHDLIY